ncbi:MAG: hypothetical protein V1679_02850 [Candidatus Peregrinibacteria bacterium]
MGSKQITGGELFSYLDVVCGWHGMAGLHGRNGDAEKLGGLQGELRTIFEQIDYVRDDLVEYLYLISSKDDWQEDYSNRVKGHKDKFCGINTVITISNDLYERIMQVLKEQGPIVEKESYIMECLDMKEVPVEFSLRVVFPRGADSEGLSSEADKFQQFVVSSPLAETLKSYGYRFSAARRGAVTKVDGKRASVIRFEKDDFGKKPYCSDELVKSFVELRDAFPELEIELSSGGIIE